MARQRGPIIREGTIGCITFYKRGDRGYARMKSSLTAERWLSDPLFAGSRESAANMALASVLASEFYNTLPKQLRRFADYHRLVSIAYRMLSDGCPVAQLRDTLEQKTERISLQRAARLNRRKYAHNPHISRSCLVLKSVSRSLSGLPSDTPLFSHKAVARHRQPLATASHCPAVPSTVDARSRGRPHIASPAKALSVLLDYPQFWLSSKLYHRSSVADCYQPSAGNTMPRRVNSVGKLGSLA